ncbi:2-oxoacid dehydrogenases acyltransferase-domain-containing protein [Rhypophila decipiens]|uniref:Dihydrolipoamide acetyltransferase component of pyruvate dehydrogenase complex n=1 Tax=Rhypophila decipiens TaxID=261697 RepID=A0AAN6YGI8_9PEZI|nr:2-oxoacid dehydrogenases acyltransferase-domain-containing protein [Rhypophila decipiens]
MFLKHSSRALRRQWRGSSRTLGQQLSASAIILRPSPPAVAPQCQLFQTPRALFHATRNLQVIKPVLLADIGEGIVECEIVQWFVEPGARVEEFSPLCEVQSDKASVEITSRFAGVVKKLHYDAGDMAKVGKPFVDIDIDGDAKTEVLEVLTPAEPTSETAPSGQAAKSEAVPVHTTAPELRSDVPASTIPENVAPVAVAPERKNTHATFATPAVRHLCKELKVDISEVPGTGKDGRVLKEDVYKFSQTRVSAPAAHSPSPPTPAPNLAFGAGALSSPELLGTLGAQKETPMVMTRTQEMMFKTMTRSLSIPHFLYADEIDFTSLVELRRRLNKVLASPVMGGDGQASKLSYLPFIIKAVSMALYKYPILNARVEVNGSNGGNSKPTVVHRSQHNIGVAMDTPQGLLVPVIKNVGSLNILGIAAELYRLQNLATAGKLSPQDMNGGTITVSNIGSIGGTYLSPVVVEKEVAILGVGRMRTVPAFSTAPGEENKVVRKEVCNFSWSADHRVVDGATLARAADVVRAIVEEPDVMVMHLR